jgi:isopenicillin N synthase-like dioxygenase
MSDFRMRGEETVLPVTRPATVEEIPIIDLKAFSFSSAAEKAKVTDSLVRACQEAGFAYIVNHGVAPQAIERIYEVAREFFDLPLAKKEEVSIKKSGFAFNGFLPTGHLGSDAKMKSDLHESFQAHLELPDDDPDIAAGTPLHGGNLWPSAMPHLRDEVLTYQAATSTLGERMLGLLALGLDLPKTVFTDFTTKPTSMLRLLHYPPQAPQDSGDSLGTRAHTDTGLITILAQDQVGGLEILLKSGEWVSAPPVKHSYVINIGDMMKTWTDGVFASTPHRVINRSGRERYSVPFFVNPNYHTPFEKLIDNPSPKEAIFESLSANPDKKCYGDWLVGVYSRIYNNPDKSAA